MLSFVLEVFLQTLLFHLMANPTDSRHPVLRPCNMPSQLGSYIQKCGDRCACAGCTLVYYTARLCYRRDHTRYDALGYAPSQSPLKGCCGNGGAVGISHDRLDPSGIPFGSSLSHRPHLCNTPQLTHLDLNPYHQVVVFSRRTVYHLTSFHTWPRLCRVSPRKSHSRL